MPIKAPKRIASAVLNSLKGGVVPRLGLEYITVGRSAELRALLHDIALIAEGGATFRLLVGRYGAGKSFLLQTLRNHALEKGFAVLDCDLSPERRLCGAKGQGLATYKELVRNLSVRTRPEGGALPLVLEKWLSGLQADVAASGLLPQSDAFEAAMRTQIFAVIRQMESLVNGFDFGQALVRYWQAQSHGDDETCARVLRWLRGEYSKKSDVRQDLGLGLMVNDENWYDFIKLLASFLVQAGYQGMLLLCDELINIYRIPHRPTRQYNYEKMLAIYNDTLQGKAGHIGVLMCATPQCLEDPDKGIFSYDALRSRLREGRFSQGARDLLAPIIRLEPLQYEEMLVLCEKLAALHADLFDYACKLVQDDYLAFLTAEYNRLGAETNLTPREVIRDFVELLNLLLQNPEQSLAAALQQGFAPSASAPEEPDDFASFEL